MCGKQISRRYRKVQATVVSTRQDRYNEVSGRRKVKLATAREGRSLCLPTQLSSFATATFPHDACVVGVSGIDKRVNVTIVTTRDNRIFIMIGAEQRWLSRTSGKDRHQARCAAQAQPQTDGSTAKMTRQSCCVVACAIRGFSTILSDKRRSTLTCGGYEDCQVPDREGGKQCVC